MRRRVRAKVTGRAGLRDGRAAGVKLVRVQGAYFLAGEGEWHPVQKAFKECHGLQCGFCTSGQLLSAAAMYGKLGAPKPALGIVHVWTGRLAVLVSVPVAVHCLYALGYADHETRVMVHSILGCFLYGVFVAKMLLLTRKSTPSWAVPLFGGVLLAAFVGIWSTSSLWFFQNAGFVL